MVSVLNLITISLIVFMIKRKETCFYNLDIWIQEHVEQVTETNKILIDKYFLISVDVSH